jgi:stage II sporulation protein D
MRFLLLLLGCVACAKNTAVEQEPAAQELHFAEPPTMRVRLASLGKRNEILLRAPQMVVVESGDAKIKREGRAVLAIERGVLTLDGDPLPTQSARVTATGGMVQIGDAAYSGALVCRLDGGLVVTNHVRMENYVLGVLRGELPLPRVPQAAAEAQAIAARSYALHYMTNPERDYDLDDTTLYQRYVGFHRAPDDEQLRLGVLATTGEYLLAGGKPLKAYYHSTCGGHTTDPQNGLKPDDTVPMRGVKCDHCKASKYYRWDATIADDAILRAADMGGSLEGAEVTLRDPAGRAAAITIRTDEQTMSVPASSFRLAVGPSTLRSTNIQSMERVSGGLHIKGAGWGHGVGLCQMGAIGLALRGKSGEEIIAYYYPDAQIRKAY